MRARSPIKTFCGLPILALASLLTAMSSLQAAETNARPNFVVILADDLGYGDLSCYGNKKFLTPHLDQLADEGLKFTDFHSNGSVCSPTRAAFLTGRYQQRAGVPGVIYANPDVNRHHGLAVSEVTLADVLREAGYRTGVVGKWHLGYDPKFNPTHNGFDVFHGYVSGNVDYHSHRDGTDIEDWWDGAEKKDEPGYSTHLITKHALEFIESNREQPFFLYIAHEAPHSPFQGPNDPPVRGPNAKKPRKDVANAYREMVTEMDKGIGEVVTTLDRLKLSENTLVFFFSDNGATREGSNGDLRGQKGTLWEGGHRVPAIARWPGKIKPGATDATACGFDLSPTIVSLAGARVPAGHQLDGIDLTTLLLDQRPLPDRTLVWSYGEQKAVRDGDWKLLEGVRGANGVGLFNLADDPSEQNNLAERHPGRVRSLREKFEQWQEDVSAGATVQPEKP